MTADIACGKDVISKIVEIIDPSLGWLDPMQSKEYEPSGAKTL
ncbi:hypothetical protein [Desulfosporosinus sp.]|nr:hypothetical protein [Desulfosporosinus sp.]